MRDARPSSSTRAGLFGRERQLTELRDTLERARAGEASTVLVVGEAGIGKTRLLQAFAEEAGERDAVVVWGRAWEAGGAPPFWPWLEALRGLRERAVLDAAGLGPERLAVLAQLLPELAPAAAPLAPPAPLDPEAARFRLFEAVGACLRGAARERTIALVLDDLHAADPGSLALLHFVARNLRDARLAVVGAYRDVEARLAGSAGAALARIAREGRYVALPRLSPDDVRRWVASVSPSAELPATLWDRTEGNPLFIVETLRLLRDRGAGAPDPATPELVREVIGARLRELAPATRALLEAAAVFGRRAGIEAAAAVAALDAIAPRDALAEAVRADVLAELAPDGVEFTHILLRDALYDALPAARRSALHAAALRLLAPHGPALTPGSLADAVHHAFEAIPAVTVDEAVRWARAAAARALDGLAYHDAADWLERAAAALPSAEAHDGERYELLLALAEAQAGAGRAARSLDSSRGAAAVARKLGDPARLAEAALSFGRIYTLASVPPELVAVLEEALAGLPRDDSPLRARLLARLASALQPARDPDHPIALARDAIAMSRRLADARTELEVPDAAGSALGYFAHPAERDAISRALVDAADRAGDRARGLRGRARLAMDLLEQGQLARAEASVREYEHLAGAIDAPSFGWVACALRAMTAMVRGRFAEAEDKLAHAAALAARIDDANAPATLAAQRLALLRAAGRDAELRDVAPAALELVFARADPWYARACAASIHASAGRLDETRAMRALIAEDLEVMRGRMSLAWVAEACIATADTALAERVFEPLAQLADRNHCWGMPALVCEGPITHALGGLAALLGRRDEAARLLLDAHARATAMEAAPWQARIERELAALGGRRRHRRTRGGGGRRAGAPAARAREEGDYWTITSADGTFACRTVAGCRSSRA